MPAKPPPKPERRVTKAQLETFLASFAKRGDAAAACEAADMTTVDYHRRTRTDPEFRARALEAWEASGEMVVSTVLARAVDGWMEPVYQGGRLVGERWCYDSSALLALLKAHRPRFFDSKVDLSSSDGTMSPPTAIIDTDDERLARMEGMFRRLFPKDARGDTTAPPARGAAEAATADEAGGPAKPVRARAAKKAKAPKAAGKGARGPDDKR